MTPEGAVADRSLADSMTQGAEIRTGAAHSAAGPSARSAERTRISPRISVIVPALNEAARIEGCLRSVHAQGEEVGHVETIVVDGGSHDATATRAAPLARVVSGPRGRAIQMNAGAALATGDVFLFLHADTALPPAAFHAVDAALLDPRVVGGTFRLRFDRATPLLDLYAYCTRFRWRAFHYGDQGIFVRRSVFDRLGGYRDVPLMEDVDFLARLRRTGRTVLLSSAVTTSARRFERHGVVRQQLLNTALVALYSLGVHPAQLARWYEQSHR